MKRTMHCGKITGEIDFSAVFFVRHDSLLLSKAIMIFIITSQQIMDFVYPLFPSCWLSDYVSLLTK